VTRRTDRTRDGADAFGGDDLYRLAVLERCVERYQYAIHTRPPAAMADVTVQVVGKIDRRGTVGQLDDTGFRRQYIDAVVQRGGLELFYPVAVHVFLPDHGIDDFALPCQQLPQPGDFFVVL